MPKIVLFGATGYTGRLTAQALVKRGATPVLAARDAKKLAALVSELGTSLETRVASSDDHASVRALLDDGDVLVTTVGPFVEHGEAALTAAIGKHAVYIDSTGEPAFIRRVFTAEHERAKHAGSLLLTAFGYDYVPGYLAAGIALREAGERATRIDVGYFATGSLAGERGYSQGTEHSSRLASIAPGLEWSGGRLVERYNAGRVREFPMLGGDASANGGERSRAAFSVCGSEHYGLPHTFPALREVNTYLGWFGKRSYMMSRGARVLAASQRLPLVAAMTKRVLELGPKSHGEGPGAAVRARTGCHVVAIPYDDAGNPLGRVDLRGPNVYDFTAEALAWAAVQARAGKTLGHGALGPIEAFGLDALVQGCAEIGLVRDAAAE